MASTISGVTRMRNTIARNGVVHLPPRRRASATPASPPRTTAISVLPIATFNEFVSDRLESGSLSKRLPVPLGAEAAATRAKRVAVC